MKKLLLLVIILLVGWIIEFDLNKDQESNPLTAEEDSIETQLSLIDSLVVLDNECIMNCYGDTGILLSTNCDSDIINVFAIKGDTLTFIHTDSDTVEEVCPL